MIMKLIREEKNLNKKLIEIEFFIVVNTKNNWLLGKNGWIDLNLPWDKRYKINVFSSEQQARRYADENCVVYPIKVPLDLSDVAVLESLHPEKNLGWMGDGGRHPVDANTFTVASNGDTISIHISDDLPDLEYKIRDGSYLDDEAVKDSGYYKDAAIEAEPLDQSAEQFSSKLAELIYKKVKEAVYNLLKPEYKSAFNFRSGGTTNDVVPMAIRLEAPFERRIPEIYGDKDTVLEELSQEQKEKIANCADISELKDLLGRSPNEEEYKVFIYPKMLQAYDKYKELGMSDKEIWSEMKDAFYYKDLIKKVFHEKTEDTFILESVIDEERSDDIYDFINQLYALRKESIAKDGEYGLGNLVFKEFRNLGYLDNLKKLRRIEKSKELSLKESAESCCDNHLKEINYKDELYETFGSELLERERGLLWPEFKNKYWLSALEKKDKYVTFNSPTMSTYDIYEWINFNNKKYLDHIITYIPGYNVMYYKNKDALERLCKAADTYLEEYNKWDASEGKKKRIADYRRLAKIDDNFVITEDNLDEQALNNTCRINYEYPKDVLIKELLN